MRYKRTIEIFHDRNRLLAVRADDDPVRPQEVFDGGSFTKKLRIGDNVEPEFARLISSDHFTELFPGSDRDGRLGDDDLVPGHGFGNATADFFYV